MSCGALGSTSPIFPTRGAAPAIPISRGARCSSRWIPTPANQLVRGRHAAPSRLASRARSTLMPRRSPRSPRWDYRNGASCGWASWHRRTRRTPAIEKSRRLRTARCARPIWPTAQARRRQSPWAARPKPSARDRSRDRAVARSGAAAKITSIDVMELRRRRSRILQTPKAETRTAPYLTTRPDPDLTRRPEAPPCPLGDCDTQQTFCCDRAEKHPPLRTTVPTLRVTRGLETPHTRARKDSLGLRTARVSLSPRPALGPAITPAGDKLDAFPNDFAGSR